MKLGFLGVGNMGGAILDGLMHSKTVDASDVMISGSNPNRLKMFKDQWHVSVASTNYVCVQKSEVIICGVKPDIHAVIAHEFKELLHDKIFVSMAAKITLKELETIYGSVPIIRIMPNLNVAVRQGIIAVCKNEYVTEEAFDSVVDLLSCLGRIVVIEESQMAGFIGLAGSSPAFVFRFIEHLVRATLNEGFTYEEALSIASDAVSGSAQYLKQSGLDPNVLVKNVSSPGGTTIEGLRVLDDYNFDEGIEKAVNAVIKKDKGLI